MMNDKVDCTAQWGTHGASCRLKFFALVHGLNLSMFERGGRFRVVAYAREELLRLHEKREFMEGLHVINTDDIECRQREKVARWEASNHKREEALR